jgi:hypothetical protein
MKGRILVGSEIQACGMFHDPGADVECKPIGKKTVKIVNETAQDGV